MEWAEFFCGIHFNVDRYGDSFHGLCVVKMNVLAAFVFLFGINLTHQGTFVLSVEEYIM